MADLDSYTNPAQMTPEGVPSRRGGDIAATIVPSGAQYRFAAAWGWRPSSISTLLGGPVNDVPGTDGNGWYPLPITNGRKTVSLKDSYTYAAEFVLFPPGYAP